MIPSGAHFVDVEVVPKTDNITERLESVILRLRPDPAYRLGRPRRAIAVIADSPWAHPPGGGRCMRLGDGLVHLCFPATDGQVCRIDESTDLGGWSLRQHCVGADGAVHFIHDEADAGGRLFFKCAPDPGIPAEE
ncbi:MAG: hypothetical protein HKO57_02445 [Akkermansiaceae bacterium]|nr:hypothetical protein [Akkermansiaceae bacterium]